MNIDRLFNIITISAWIVFAVFVTYLVVRTTRKQGIWAGLRSPFSLRVLLLLLVVVCITIFSTSLVFVEPQDVGVVISVFAPRGVRDQPLRSGLHWIAPLAEQVVTYPISWQTYTMSGKPLEGEKKGDDSIAARTYDGQEVAIDCSVIFRIDREQVVRVHIDWQERYIRDLIRPLTRGLIRTEVSQFTVDEVNSYKRRDLESELDRRLREELEDKGLILDAFVLRNIAFSPEYAASVEQKQVALQGTTQKKYEADQIRRLSEGRAFEITTLAEAEAKAIETKAQAEAKARLIRAQAEAEALKVISEPLAENLNLLTYQYIDKLSPGIQVMLVPSNAPLILPLPGLGPTATLTVPVGTPTSTPTPTPTPTP